MTQSKLLNLSDPQSSYSFFFKMVLRCKLAVKIKLDNTCQVQCFCQIKCVFKLTGKKREMRHVKNIVFQ